jgi:hypothetical protein
MGKLPPNMMIWPMNGSDAEAGGLQTIDTLSATARAIINTNLLVFFTIFLSLSFSKGSLHVPELNSGETTRANI